MIERILLKAISSVALLSGLIAAGCTASPTVQPNTIVPSPATMTETFTGTVGVQGSDTHTFTVAQTGAVDITLTAVVPASNTTMGLGVGTPTGLSCFAVASVQSQAGPTPQLRGTALAGQLCVIVYDIGNLTDPVDYTVTVAHP